MRGLWVPSLLGECLPVKKHQNIKQKQYCNKFTKDFKHGPYLKKKKILKNKEYSDS